MCGLSGEIKANEMWQMEADMKTESWVASIPKHIRTPLIYIIGQPCWNDFSPRILSAFYWCTGATSVQTKKCVHVCVAKCVFSSIWRNLCSPGETLGSHVAQANGQLMGLHTAQSVPKCLQIKQFVIFCVYTCTTKNTYANRYASIHAKPPSETPRNRPEAYHSVYIDSLALVNTQLTWLCLQAVMCWAVLLSCG